MKKFIALLMALVMTMSLATVAWGAAMPAPVDGVIALSADLTLDTQFTHSTGNVTIKAADPTKPVTITTNDLADAFYVTGGTLTLGAGLVINSNTAIFEVSGTGKVIIDGAELNVTGGQWSAVCAKNGGTIELVSGSINQSGVDKVTVSIKGTGASLDMSGGAITSGDSSALIAYEGGTATISGGTVTSANNYAAYACGGGSITVSGGTVTNDVDNKPALVASKTYGTTGGSVTVKSGTVKGVLAWEASDSSAVIEGGNVTGDVDAANGATVSITGGTFTTDVSEYLAGGKEATLSNGQYIITTKTSAAGTTTTLKNADKYDIYGITGTTSVKTPNADITKKVTDNVYVTVDGKTTTTYTATTYSDGVKVYVEVDSSVANYKLTKNGAIVAYLVDLASVGDVPTTTQTVTSYVKAVETPKCGEYNKAIYANGVYMIDGKAYAAGGANWALLNGKFVNYGGEAAAVPHTYAVNTYNTADKSVATLKCTECKQVFTVLTAAQVKTLAPNAYAQVNVAGTNYFIAVAATSAGTTTGGTVTSAETFDAGIAMYVGMSVMAAAGSAVVIGKKKD